MPNWCNNRIIVFGEETKLKRFLKETTNEKGEFTFEKLVPRPPELDITSGSSVDNAIDVLAANNGDWTKVDEKLQYPAWVKDAKITEFMPLKKKRELMLAKMNKNLSEKDMQEGRQALDNIRKYGYKDWYKWNISNWGTKWDACGENASIDDMGDSIEIQFDTAWAPPIQWIEKVELLFPDLEFELHYEEPGMCFKGVYSKGIDKCIEY